MIDFLRRVFKKKPSTDYRALIQNGAIIIDVRSVEEFANGNIRGSKNIPLGKLPFRLNHLDRAAPIITCCLSGIRSGVARDMLIQEGFSEVYNGGGWSSLNQQLN